MRTATLVVPLLASSFTKGFRYCVIAEVRCLSFSSLIYKIDVSSRFTIQQQISTVGARSVNFFVVGSTHYLVIGEQDKVSVHAWDTAREDFSMIQHIPAKDVHNVHTYTATTGISECSLRFRQLSRSKQLFTLVRIHSYVPDSVQGFKRILFSAHSAFGCSYER